jgi:hypothetical protein
MQEKQTVYASEAAIRAAITVGIMEAMTYGSGNFNAQLCVFEARNCIERRQWEDAKRWVMKAIAYNDGQHSELYIKQKEYFGL